MSTVGNKLLVKKAENNEEVTIYSPERLSSTLNDNPISTMSFVVYNNTESAITTGAQGNIAVPIGVWIERATTLGEIDIPVAADSLSPHTDYEDLLTIGARAEAEDNDGDPNTNYVGGLQISKDNGANWHRIRRGIAGGADALGADHGSRFVLNEVDVQDPNILVPMGPNDSYTFMLRFEVPNDAFSTRRLFANIMVG